MRLRDRASGELVERTDEEAKELLAAGTHEAAAGDAEKAIATDPIADARNRGRYDRRDMRAEE